MNELHKFEEWMKSGIEALSPSSRRVLFRRIAIDVRKFNQSNITKQQAPDGTKWEARKRIQSKPGQIKKKAKMMMGLRLTRRMGVKATSDGAEIGFSGRTAQIATVHHTGGMDYVSKDGPKIEYPMRQLLGFSPELLSLIEDRVIAHLTGDIK
jgi:phage virion morphogenesis protein